MKSVASVLLGAGGILLVYSLIGISFLSYRQKGVIYRDQALLVAKILFGGLLIGSVGGFILTT